MVLWQLCTLEHLRTSSFGCPPPRHGLQLLFWFAKDCVTSDPHISMKAKKKFLKGIRSIPESNKNVFRQLSVEASGKGVFSCELIQKLSKPSPLRFLTQLQSHIQPEQGDFGFHVFGNVEELLPALNKGRKHKKQLVYFAVGNLNSDRYAAAASLPPYVRENYNTSGGYNCNNMDGIIISYQRTSQQVEAVFITEHDDANLGRFRHDGTFQVSAELIRALQNPQLDLTAFLSQMGYYGDVEVMAAAGPVEPLVFSMMQNDPTGFFMEGFSHQMQFNMEPFGCRRLPEYASAGDRAAQCAALQRKNRKPKASRKARQTQVFSNWEPAGWSYSESYGWEPWQYIEFYYPGSYHDKKKGPGGGGFSFRKMLLSIGAIYVAFKCLSWWLRSSSKEDWNETILKILPRKPPSYPDTHVMLDYVY